MKIAVVGAGFAGLALSYYYLEKYPNASLTIFEAKKIGGGASGVAAGLIHSFPGANASKAQFADESMQCSLQLFEIASKALGRPVHKKCGLLRFVQTDKHLSSFQKCAKKYPEVKWLDENATKPYPHPNNSPALWIENAYQVICQDYIEGLFLACKKLGAKIQYKKIDTLEKLDSFDQIFIAAGEGSRPFLPNLSLRCIKGQMLTLKMDAPTNLPCALSSVGYLVQDKDPQILHAGSTYEREFEDHESDLPLATDIVKTKISKFYPSIIQGKVLKVSTGIRIYGPDRHFPLAKKIGPKHYILTGFGSKGLLHHAYFAKKLLSEASK